MRYAEALCSIHPGTQFRRIDCYAYMMFSRTRRHESANGRLRIQALESSLLSPSPLRAAENMGVNDS